MANKHESIVIHHYKRITTLHKLDTFMTQRMNTSSEPCVLNSKNTEYIKELFSLCVTVSARRRNDLSMQMEGVINTLDFATAVSRHVVMYTGWQDKMIPSTGSWLPWMTPAHVKGKIIGIVKDIPMTVTEGGITRSINEDVFVYDSLGEFGHMVLGLHAARCLRTSVYLYPCGGAVKLRCICNPAVKEETQKVKTEAVSDDNVNCEL